MCVGMVGAATEGLEEQAKAEEGKGGDSEQENPLGANFVEGKNLRGNRSKVEKILTKIIETIS